MTIACRSSTLLLYWRAAISLNSIKLPVRLFFTVQLPSQEDPPLWSLITLIWSNIAIISLTQLLAFRVMTPAKGAAPKHDQWLLFSVLNCLVDCLLESEDRKWTGSPLCVIDVSQVRSDWLLQSFLGSLSLPSAGAHWCCHAQHQPRWDGGRRRGSGGRLWRRCGRIFGARRGEWPSGDTRFPKSWTSRFSLHEQSC